MISWVIPSLTMEVCSRHDKVSILMISTILFRHQITNFNAIKFQWLSVFFSIKHFIHWVKLHQYRFIILKHHNYEDFNLHIVMFSHFTIELCILYFDIDDIVSKSNRIYTRLNLLSHLSFVRGIFFLFPIDADNIVAINVIFNRKTSSFIRY